VSVVILSPPADRPPRDTPLVTLLRQQIRRGAVVSLLERLAGGAAELRRLTATYRLDAPLLEPEAPAAKLKMPLLSAPPAPGRPRQEREPLHGRQATLLGMLGHLAAIGETFPGTHALGEALECSWLVVERDLGQLARRGFIRFRKLQHGGTVIDERWEICRTGLSLSVPGKPNGVRG
jgi:hypothetical protein